MIIGNEANPDELAARLPAPVQRLGIAIFARTPIGRRMIELLPTAGPEIERILANDCPADTYARIKSETLLATGAKSSRYFAQTCDALAAVLPNSQRVTIPRATHNTANIAPRRLSNPLLSFFASAT
jgi:pimeloyl-ACP methyl ester carboxylesterase